MAQRTSSTSEDVANALAGLRVAYSDESDLQDAVCRALIESGRDAVREVRLSDGASRVDVLVDGSIGVEVKIRGSWPDVSRQLMRYARCEEVDGLVLVSTVVSHNRVPSIANGKPVQVVTLLGAAL